jgi:hypothetical protein
VTDDEELVRHVAGSLAISYSQAARIVGDVVAFYREPVEDVVRRRHAACQLLGMSNAQIYGLIISELDTRVVAAPELSERQVRRIIYG